MSAGVRVVSANTDWARRGDGAYLRYLAGQGAEVMLLQEAKDTDVSEVLPVGWLSLQDTRNAGRKGSCVAVRRSIVKVRWHRLRLGSRPFIGGRRVKQLVRWHATAGLTGAGRMFPVVSTHFPKKAFAALQPGHLKTLRAFTSRHPRVVVGTDANQPIGKVGHDLGLSAYGKGIVGVLTNLPVTDVVVDWWGVKHGYTDHPAVFVTVHP